MAKKLKFSFLLLLLGFILLPAKGFPLGFSGSFSGQGSVFDSGSDDIAYAINCDTTTRRLYINGRAGNDFLLTCYDYNGNLLSSASFICSGAVEDSADSVIVHPSGYVYTAGRNNSDVYILKYTSALVFVSSTVFDSGDNGQARAVSADTDGNVYVAGFTGTSPNFSYLTLKYDSSLQMVSSATFVSGTNNQANAIVINNSGNVYLTGKAIPDVTDDWITVKYDSTLNFVSSVTYDSGQNDTAYGLTLDNSGNVLVTGTKAEGSADSDFKLIKYDSDLNLVNEVSFNSSNNDFARAIAVDDNGYICIAGYKNNGTDNDIIALKYDSSLVLLSSRSFNSGYDDFGYSLSVDSSAYLYISGYSNNGTNSDYRAIRYSVVPPASGITYPSNNLVTKAFFMISGTASGQNGIDFLSKVEAGIRRNADNYWWDGENWGSSQVFNTVSGTTTWNYNVLTATSMSNGQYWIVSRASTTAGGIESPLNPGVTIYFDNTPPVPVSNLTALPGPQEGNIQLKWTAPGDDGTTGNVTNYLVKYATYQVTSASFYSAATYYHCWGSFSATGTEELRILTGFSNDTTYFFALKAFDDMDNYSAWVSSFDADNTNISNWSYAQMDVSSPAAITSITAAETGFRHVTLRWTAPREDSSADPYNKGTAVLNYEIRCCSFSIVNEQVWQSTTTYRIITGSQCIPGETQSLVCTGLNNGTSYYFAIKTTDERGNQSQVSASSAKVLPFNTLPPSAGTILSAVGLINTNNFTFYWSSPTAGSDDYLYGDRISSYTLYLSTFAPSSSQIGTSTRTFITSSTFYAVAELNENTTFWFKLITQDSEGGTKESNFFKYTYYIWTNAVNEAPASFTLVSPSSGTTVTYRNDPPYNERATLQWTASSDPDPGDFLSSYKIYISSTSDFIATVTTTVVVASSVTQANMFSLLDDTTYWWFVVATDSGAPFGYQVKVTSSAVWRFLVNCRNDIPLKFNCIYPSSSSLVNISTPSLVWEQASDPDPGGAITGYRLYYSSYTSNMGPSSPEGTMISCGLNTSWTSVALEENIKYYWCVEARDNWSVPGSTMTSVYSFYVNTATEPPAGLGLNYPLEVVHSSYYKHVDFDWQDTMDPDPPPYDSVAYYILYFSTSSNFEAICTTFTFTNISSVTVNFDFLVNTTYYWNVQSHGAGDPASLFGTAVSTGAFTVRKYAPANYSLLSPLGMYDTTTYYQLVFQWEVAIDTDPQDSIQHYIMYFSTDSGFGAGITTYTPNLSTNTVTISQVFLLDTTYYWNVRSYATNDPPYLYGLANSSGSFTIFKRPPGSYSLFTPAGGVHSYWPEFTWQKAVDPDLYDEIESYKLYYSTSMMFENSITTFTAALSTTYYQMPITTPISLKTTYYWNVRTYDSTGLYTLAPSTGSFYLANRVPLNFNLSEPINNTIVLTDTPAFIWQQSGDVDGDDLVYTLIYSTDSNFAYFATSVTTVSGVILPDSLAENSTYYWKVKVYDGYEYTFSLNTGSFRVNAVSEIPLEFNLIAPDGLINTSTPVFSWAMTSDLDPGNYVDYYRVVYSSDYFKTLISSSFIRSDSLTLPVKDKLVENISYKWYVEAVDSTNKYRVSNSTLTIIVDAANDLPDVFGLVSPEGLCTARNPVFTWQPAGTTEWWQSHIYNFYCGTVAQILPSIIKRGVSTTTVTLDSDLTENTTYWWFVEAVDNIGQVRESTSHFTFFVSTTNDAPMPFNPVEPAYGSSISTRTPRFVWEKAIDPDEPAGDRVVSYTLSYSTSVDFSFKTTRAGLTTNYHTVADANRLRQNATYYWEVSAYDLSNDSSTTQIYSFFVRILSRLRPPEYFTGTELSAGKDSFTIYWSNTLTYEDNSVADDLAGYNIYRADNVTGDYTLAGFSKQAQWTDTAVNNKVWYYFVRTVNNTGIESRDSSIIASGSSPLNIAVNEEKNAYVALSESISTVFRQESKKTYVYKNADVYEIQVKQESNGIETMIPDYRFSQPVTLSFIVSAPATGMNIQSTPKAYSIFWYNGVEYINVSAHFDASANRVYVNTVYTGKYKVMQVNSSDFSINNIVPRKIFTPNNSGPENTETLKIFYTNNTGQQVSCDIYDLYGAFVNRMGSKTDLNEYLQWDGRDESGNYVKKGIYMYQIKVADKFYSGTIIVAR